MAREKPPPEVIVFHEPAPSRPPRWKGKEEVRETGAGVALSKATGAADLRRQGSDNVLDFKATLQEVIGLATEELEGRERRQAEQDQLVALGAKPPKKQRVPFATHQLRVRGSKQKEARGEEPTHKVTLSSKKREPKRLRGRSRWKESYHEVQPAVGKMASGVLHVSAHELKARKGRPRARKNNLSRMIG